MANIYTLLNFLEKNKIYLGEHEMSKKILVCLYPLIPRMSSSLFRKIFNNEISEHKWPEINKNLIEENEINLPIQIKGKLISTINTKKGYKEKDLLDAIEKAERRIKREKKLKEKQQKFYRLLKS